MLTALMLLSTTASMLKGYAVSEMVHIMLSVNTSSTALHLAVCLRSLDDTEGMGKTTVTQSCCREQVITCSLNQICAHLAAIVAAKHPDVLHEASLSVGQWRSIIVQKLARISQLQLQNGLDHLRSAFFGRGNFWLR